MKPWKDKIKRGTEDEVESSEMHVGRFRITVHRHIAYPKDVWLASCTDLFSQRELPHKDLEHAKSAAVAKVKSILDALPPLFLPILGLYLFLIVVVLRYPSECMPCTYQVTRQPFLGEHKTPIWLRRGDT